MIGNIITSIYNAQVQFCCGGRADHREITREQAMEYYNELVRHYKDLYNKQRKISCVSDKLSPCYKCWIWSVMIELIDGYKVRRWYSFNALV